MCRTDRRYTDCAAERDKHSSRHCVLHCSRTETDSTLTAAERDRHSSRQCVQHCSSSDRRYTDCAVQKDSHSNRQCVLHCSRLVSRTETDSTLTVQQIGTGTVADSVFCTAAGQRQTVHQLCGREGQAQ
jgi:hypothetical protein